MLPKIHKPGNPGRPIISAIDNPTSTIAEYVDHHLQPIAEELPSYIKDTGAFLRKINSMPPPQGLNSGHHGRDQPIYKYPPQGRN